MQTIFSVEGKSEGSISSYMYEKGIEFDNNFPVIRIDFIDWVCRYFKKQSVEEYYLCLYLYGYEEYLYMFESFEEFQNHLKDTLQVKCENKLKMNMLSI